MSRHMEIAKTIHSQIRMSGIKIMGSWGFNSPAAGEKFGIIIDSETGETYSKNSLAYLQFKVNGRLHRGFVYVLYMADDTYTVLTVKMRQSGPKIKCKVTNELENIYGEDLVEIIDGLVETPMK